MFLAPPKSFNDPYDCRITKSYNILKSAEEKDHFIQYLRNRDEEILRSQGINVDSEMVRIRNILDNPAQLKIFQKQNDDVYFKMQDMFYGVVSFCMNWRNFVVWSYYADSHKGFAVGFNEELLRHSGLFGDGGKVKYKYKIPIIHPEEEDIIKRAFQETHTKSIYWRHEKEYRLTKRFFPNEPSEEDRKAYFPDNFIRNVIIGCEATEETVNEILAITSEKNIETFKLQKLKNKFGLFRKRIVPNV